MPELQTSEGSPSIQYVLLGAASLGLVLAAGFLLSQPSPSRVDVEGKRGDHRSEVLKKLRAEEDAKLTKTEWVSKDAGVARVPIEVAMRLAEKELAAKPKKPSAVKVEAPVAVPAGDAPSMPSAPSGASIIHFPRLSKGASEAKPQE